MILIIIPWKIISSLSQSTRERADTVRGISGWQEKDETKIVIN